MLTDVDSPLEIQKKTYKIQNTYTRSCYEFLETSESESMLSQLNRSASPLSHHYCHHHHHHYFWFSSACLLVYFSYCNSSMMPFKPGKEPATISQAASCLHYYAYKMVAAKIVFVNFFVAKAQIWGGQLPPGSPRYMPG